jgi:hypothetical protein
MTTHVFCEIVLDRRVTSVYDEPEIEVDINMRVYHLPIENDLSHLVVHILKNFNFKSDKNVSDLGMKVIGKIKIFEQEHDITSNQPMELMSFYERLQEQNYEDGIHYPYKYPNVSASSILNLATIITTAYKLQIIPKKMLLKYLLSDAESYTYHLEETPVEHVKQT